MIIDNGRIFTKEEQDQTNKLRQRRRFALLEGKDVSQNIQKQKMQQKTLTEKKVEYHRDPYNKCDDQEQWIRISDGCYRDCPFCYCPKDVLYYDIPKIERNIVKIMDMNFLYACPNPKDKIKQLGKVKVNKKVVYYELICGIDWRLLDLETAQILKDNRFKNIRLAWDNELEEQKIIKKAIDHLKRVGYKHSDISVFILCNYYKNYEDCLKKLDLLKIWRVKVNDCWYDNQTPPNIIPIKWTMEQIKDFRKRCRKHNQMVLFGIDPELSQN